MLSLAPAQAPAERPRITAINHVALRVGDLAAARTFYGQVLGLSARASRGSQVTYAVGARQAIVVESGLRPGDDERLMHVAFETPDVTALGAYLTARGLQPQADDSCRQQAIRVVDPEGHAIEFVQASWPPPVSAPPAPESQALSDRILHAGLIVADEQRAQTLYRTTLSFLEIWRGGRPEGVTRWVNMRVPDGTDYLEYMLATSSPDRRERGVMHHLCLRVPDMQSAWEEVARRSVRLKRDMPSPPQIGVNGRYQLNLYDPDGTRVELMEPFTVR
jgi:catechol 2,3-dioxygenase-like lactoylglutathione lyase family enzyme